MGYQIKQLPPQAYLLECFDYVDGELIWLQRPREHFKTQGAWVGVSKRTVGKSAFTLSNGYYVVSVDSNLYQAHRVVYKHQTGNEPLYIDHIDRDKLNNKIENLRDVTPSINSHNRGDNTQHHHLPNGIRFHDNKYHVRVCFTNQAFELGSYHTLTQAVEVLNEAKQNVKVSLLQFAQLKRIFVSVNTF